ncbi:MAG TPA: tripartite tricarboxylate transporter substrate binding protein [Pseudorhodoferax sp.]|jgi:tripartite-type tricarboxylate transporter receptor subunit TctC|nr:tripartite tricarboxylate transporter substrate binding protein [Pseudorhodoferax sp.]
MNRFLQWAGRVRLATTARAVSSACAAAALLAAPGMALAQDWPQRPVKLVVAGPPGGGGDVLARLLAVRLGEGLGQPVVVENKAGAGGVLASTQVATAAPDGYTILLGTSSTHGINPGLYAKLPFDPLLDFTPVALVATNKFVMAVPAASPARTVPEFIAMAKAAPGKHHYGSSGNATTSHLAGALFVSLTGAPLVHVPYKGNAPALTDLLADRVSVMFDNITAMENHFRAKSLRPIGTTGTTRAAALPEVPTLAEQGVPGYEIGGWFALLGPARMRPEVVARLHRETARVLALPEVRERMTAMGADPQIGSPAELGQLIAAEIPRWKTIIQAAGAKLD